MKRVVNYLIVRLPIIMSIIAIYVFQVEGTPSISSVDGTVTIKKIALTFDDGPVAETTPMLLEALKERNIVATFFVQGKQAARNPDIIDHMHKAGHEIGNHTYNHVDLRKLSDTQIRQECEKTDQVIEHIIGEKTKLVRPTFGAYNQRVTSALCDKYVVLWSLDTRDWESQNVDSIVRIVMNKVKNGDIILFHDVYDTSVEAAIIVMDKLLEEGYEFVTVSQLIDGSSEVVEKQKVIKSIR